MGDVRGKGLMIGIELVKDGRRRKRQSRKKQGHSSLFFEKGLLMLGAGENVIRFSPPLTHHPGTGLHRPHHFEEVLGRTLRRH